MFSPLSAGTVDFASQFLPQAVHSEPLASSAFQPLGVSDTPPMANLTNVAGDARPNPRSAVVTETKADGQVGLHPMPWLFGTIGFIVTLVTVLLFVSRKTTQQNRQNPSPGVSALSTSTPVDRPTSPAGF
jgi:hypothetical protein